MSRRVAVPSGGIEGGRGRSPAVWTYPAVVPGAGDEEHYPPAGRGRSRQPATTWAGRARGMRREVAATSRGAGCSSSATPRRKIDQLWAAAVSAPAEPLRLEVEGVEHCDFLGAAAARHKVRPD